MMERPEVHLLGADNVPIAVYMNYAMHPINFYLSGVISADFPGEASRYIEELFDNRTVAIFSQGASGDQNPRDFRSPTTFMGQRAALSQGRGPFVQTIGAPTVASGTLPQGFNAQQASAERRPIPDYIVFSRRACSDATLIGAESITSDVYPVWKKEFSTCAV